MNKAVVVLSGGLDSSTLLHDVFQNGTQEELIGLSINYNQRHSVELECAKWQCDALGIEHVVVDMSAVSATVLQGSALTSDIDVPEGHYEADNAKITVVPSRNMLLISAAASFLVSRLSEDGSGALYYGAHAGDFAVYADCRPEFVQAMQSAVEACDFRDVTLRAPYVDIMKWDIAQKAKDLGLLEKGEFSDIPIKHTHTCYNGLRPADGVCPTCQERVLSFHRIGEKDPLEYADGWDAAVAHALKVQEEFETKNK